MLKKKRKESLPTQPRIVANKRKTPTETSPAAGAANATVGIVVCGGLESQLHPVSPSLVTLQIFVQYELSDDVKSLPENRQAYQHSLPEDENSTNQDFSPTPIDTPPTPMNMKANSKSIIFITRSPLLAIL